MKHWGLIGAEKGLHAPGRIVSDTGEIEYNYSGGYLAIATDRILAHAGKFGFDKVELGRFSLQLANEDMAVSFFSKDGQPLGVSSHVLMQAVGKVENTGMEWDETKLMSIGHGPLLIDQIEGKMHVKDARAIVAYILDGEGNRVGTLPVQTEECGVCVIFDGKTAAVSYEMIIK